MNSKKKADVSLSEGKPLTMGEAVLETMGPLVGGKIAHLLKSPNGENYGFAVIKGSRRWNVWVLQDPEGNGPGFLDVTPADE